MHINKLHVIFHIDYFQYFPPKELFRVEFSIWVSYAVPAVSVLSIINVVFCNPNDSNMISHSSGNYGVSGEATCIGITGFTMFSLCYYNFDIHAQHAAAAVN